MGYFALSGITGCIFPETGTSVAYDVTFNDDKIVAKYKKDETASRNNDWVYLFMVICVFENTAQIFKFISATDRDTFYNSLP